MSDDSEAPAGYVPSLDDFEQMARTMDRQRSERFVIDGRIVKGRIVKGVFTPDEAGVLQEFAADDAERAINVGPGVAALRMPDKD